MAWRAILAAMLGVLAGLFIGLDVQRPGVGVSQAQAQSFESFVRRITRPATRKRKRTRRKSSAPQRPRKTTAQSKASPAPPTPNPRRSVGAAAATGAATGAAASAALAADTKPAAKPQTKKAVSKAAPPKTWTEVQIVDALKSCVRLLAPHDVDAAPAPAIRSGRCGDPAPVTLKRIGSGQKAVTFRPAVTVNCQIAARFAEWLEKRAQPAAEAAFGARINRITGANGYACRNRYGAKTGRLSEHALANAIDIPTLELANGKRISVMKDWGRIERAKRQQARGETARRGETRSSKEKRKVAPRDIGLVAAEVPAVPLRNPVRRGRTIREARAIILASYRPAPKTRSATRAPSQAAKTKATNPRFRPVAPRDETTLAFLKGLHASACEMFGTVLGPEANRAHEDHFHFDLAPRRRSAYCR